MILQPVGVLPRWDAMTDTDLLIPACVGIPARNAQANAERLKLMSQCERHKQEAASAGSKSQKYSYTLHRKCADF
jgi:hypothetical protein